MKRILTWIVCLGLASTMAAQAKGKEGKEDKGGKKGRHAEVKFERQEAKIARKGFRGEQRRIRSEERVLSSRRPGFERRAAPLVNVDVSPRVNRVARLESAIARRGPANFSWSYDEARRNYTPGVQRERSYYTGRYDRFALFAGGYYYFDRGYWYPAYGYDPAYSRYRFDEPIYGYNDLDPSRVLVNVQTELRRQGYYHGSIDGLIGPETRAAVGRYQRDLGLYVTRAIDGPTLAALGLT